MLRELSRKELVRPARRSSIDGEAEYAFWHVLARDVAYGQLPRASRASRHVAAARWIESKAPERVEDLADVLAYHYATALELAKAAGQSEQASALEAPALRFLSLAGERALGLDTAAALANLERALALAPPGHPERPAALVRLGEAASQAARYTEAAAAMEEAIAAFRAAGDLPATAGAMAKLVKVFRRLGDPRQWTYPAEAVAILEPLEPGPALVTALTEVTANEAIRGESEVAVRDAERVLVLAGELGLGAPRTRTRLPGHGPHRPRGCGGPRRLS
jgi:tetratricopeptide (TPR) repeat protein